MRIRSLHHVSIMVSDLKRAEEFYCDLLGLKSLPRPQRLVEGLWLAAGNTQLHLIVGRVDPAPAVEERKVLERVGVARHFALAVTDVHAAAEFLEQRGQPPLGSVIERPEGAASVFLRDPDGNLVELIQFAA